MPLSNGTRLGPYEITAQLGAGGMGEVYCARDTRLDRTVAVKVTAEQFGERFEREARLISSLNHPHICTLFDVGPNYFVMELVEGPTLADRIAEGPMPLAEALAVARQVVEALEAAHEKGIIHRDLKPANVKLTGDGAVKVLDFGLAKATEPAASAGSDPTASPTLTLDVTRAGMILGTAAYMAPEQARGIAVDRRADVWAFGVLLFEMLTGRRTFGGDTTTDVLAAVIRAEPDWRALPPSTPPAILRLLRRCLEKDRKRRLPDIGVARLEIDEALAAPAEKPPPPAPAPSGRRSLLPWTFAALAIAIAVLALWQYLRQPRQEAWAGEMLGALPRALSPRLSPDGQLLAFMAFIDELPQLGVMKPDGSSWSILTTDRDNGYVVGMGWARDGSKLYFGRYWGQPRGVYSIPPLGGEPRLLLEDAFAPEPLPDGSLIVQKMTAQGDQQAFRFYPDSGKLEPLEVFLVATDTSSELRASTDGRHIVFYGAFGNPQRNQTPRLQVFEVASGKTRELAPGFDFEPQNSWCPVDFARDGKSIFAIANEGDSRTLFNFPLDGGRPRRLISFPKTSAPLNIDASHEGVLYLDQMLWFLSAMRLSPTGAGSSSEQGAIPMSSTRFSVLPDGSLAYPARVGGHESLQIMREGRDPRGLVESAEPSSTPATLFGANMAFVLGAGDERRIAIASQRDGRVIAKFTAPAADVVSLVASPDHRTLFYASAGFIWAQPVAGGEPRKITHGTAMSVDPAGGHLFVKRSPQGANELWRMTVEGKDEQRLKIPAEYHLSLVPLAASAVDSRGRLLLTVLSPHSFYYRPAMLDTRSGAFSLVPISVDGDVLQPAWMPDGRIAVLTERYSHSMWRYRAK